MINGNVSFWWSQIDMAHAHVYAQRTADDRIAIGGRGVPYRFGSRTDSDGHTPA